MQEEVVEDNSDSEVRIIEEEAQVEAGIFAIIAAEGSGEIPPPSMPEARDNANAVGAEEAVTQPRSRSRREER